MGVPVGSEFGGQSLLDAVGEAVIVTTPEGRITYWNRQAERVFGWTRSEVEGRDVLEVTPATLDVPDAADIMAALVEGRSWSGDMVLRRKDGSTFIARVTDTPILGADGEIVGIVGLSSDVTEQRQAESRLAKEEERLRVALAAGRLATWEWDRAEDVLVWDERMVEVIGLAGARFSGTFEDYLTLVHPDDREHVRRTIDETMTRGGMHEVEHRVVLGDGSLRWINARGATVHDDNGAATGLVGVAADVTARREAAEERERLLADEAAARADAELARGRMQFLADATAAINEPLDLGDRLRRLAELGAPYLADICAVYLLDADGSPSIRAAHLGDGSLDEQLTGIMGSLPFRPDAPTGVMAAVREEEVTWVSHVTDDLLRASTDSDETLRWLRGLGLRSNLAVPLRGRDRVIGALTFITFVERQMSDDDVLIAVALGERGGLAIENAMLVAVREEMEREAQFQAAVLRSMQDAATDGILIVSDEGRVLSYNQCFVDLWGFEPEVLAELTDDALLEVAVTRVVDPQSFLRRVRSLYTAPDGPSRDEIVLVNGTVLQRVGTPLHGPDGAYFGWAWHFRDVTEDRRREQEIIAAAERSATLARVLQGSLLPPVLPDVPGVDLAARYHPAYEGVDVGGDFYDVFAVQDGWMLVIGDVCGKGAAAAALTGLVRYTIRAAAMHARTLPGMLAEVNATMLAHQPDPEQPQFATVCCLRLHAAGGVVSGEVACAGHEPPMLLLPDGSVRTVAASGTVLGVVPDFGAVTAAFRLDPGSAIVAFTDGITEARGPNGEFFGEDGLARVLRPVAGESSEVIGAAVEHAALDWQGGTASDDIAVLVAQPAPSGS